MKSKLLARKLSLLIKTVWLLGPPRKPLNLVQSPHIQYNPIVTLSEALHKEN